MPFFSVFFDAVVATPWHQNKTENKSSQSRQHISHWQNLPRYEIQHIKQKACQFHEPLNKHQSVCFFDVVFLRIPFPRHPKPPCHWDPRENKPTMPTVILFLSQDVDENIDLYGLYINICILTVVDSPSIPRVPIAIFWEDRFHRLSNLLKGSKRNGK